MAPLIAVLHKESVGGKMKSRTLILLVVTIILGVMLVSWSYTQRWVGPFKDAILLSVLNLVGYAASFLFTLPIVARWFAKE